jgi:hypothetical protein
MKKTMTASLLALSIAFTSVSATPVEARSKDVAKVIAGIALLAIIGAAVNDNRRHRATPVPAPTPSRWRLPNRCLKDYETERGWQRGFGSACLRKHAPRVTLPRQCKVTLWTTEGRRNVYAPGCLSDRGYRFAGW